jgi:phosphonate transport system ATP-binding protein
MTTKSTDHRASSSACVVVVDGLGVTYGSATGSAPALDGVSLFVHAGERVGLLGPSGSGKTSLLNVLAGIVEPTAGLVRVFDLDVRSLPMRKRRHVQARIGMVHQHLNLVGPLKVVHNVNAGRLGRWGNARGLWSLVRPAEIDETRTVLARLGIADKLTERTSSLSGGQQQRVALARVLRQQPDLILADEPVSAVDPGWSREVLTQLSAEVSNRGVALVVALHDVLLARQFCDRIIGMRDGRVLFDAPTDEIDDGAVNDLYRLDPRPADR